MGQIHLCYDQSFIRLLIHFRKLLLLLLQSENGGSTNAYTSSESTNYHFDINQQHLEGALDRFAQFFISPTISQDGVEREVNAVDSE